MVLFRIIIVFFVLAGIALLIWRKELSEVQAMMLGARLHSGCAVAEGITLFILAVLFFLGLRSGAFG